MNSKWMVLVAALVGVAGCAANERGIASPYEARTFAQIKMSDDVKLVRLGDNDKETPLVEGHADGSVTKNGVVIGHVVGNAIYDKDWNRLATVNNPDDIEVRGKIWRMLGGGRIDPMSAMGIRYFGSAHAMNVGAYQTELVGPQDDSGGKWLIRMTSNGYFTIARWGLERPSYVPIKALGNASHLEETAALLALTWVFTAPDSGIEITEPAVPN
jgi:hypothetical protein